MKVPRHLIALGLLLLGAVPEAGGTQTGAGDALAWEPYALKAGDGRPIAAELGWLVVPESRTRPGGDPVRLALLRLRSTAPSPRPPIVYLSGGPGGSGIAEARGSLLPLFESLREIADVVVLDQRGTGMSRPQPMCRESWLLPLDRVVPYEEVLAMARDRSRACAGMLRQQGFDLAAYNTQENADDLESLRQALGVPRLNLLGVSYGTQLALTAIRRHSGSFERAVLAGVKAPHHALRLPATFDSELSKISPSLPSRLADLLRRLEKKPVTVDVPLPLAAQTAHVVVGPFDLQMMVVQTLWDRQLIARLPGQIQSMAQGDWSALGKFTYGLRKGWLGSAMPYTVDCSAGIAAERRQRITRETRESLLGEAVNFPFPEICEAWGVPDLGPGSREPVRSDVPALLISGSLDIRTPPADAEEVLRGLPNGVLLSLDGAGHGDDLLLSSPRIAEAVREFFGGKAPTERWIGLPSLDFTKEGKP